MLRASGGCLSLVCEACGNGMTAGERFCRVCGREATAGLAGASQVGATGPPAETSGKAVFSLICGLLFFIPLLFVAAIVFGHLALSDIRKSAGRLKGTGLATAGLTLGYLWIPGIPIFLILAAIAIPNLLRARMAANESSAVGAVRSLVVSEVTYASLHPHQGYTCSLSDLAQAASIRGPLASGQKNGYVFELTGCSAGTEGGANVKFQVVAYPLRVNQTGVRAFCSDESDLVRVDSGGSARGCVENGSLLQ
jgi:type IV pilus assembly protein PilA